MTVVGVVLPSSLAVYATDRP